MKASRRSLPWSVRSRRASPLASVASSRSTVKTSETLRSRVRVATTRLALALSSSDFMLHSVMGLILFSPAPSLAHVAERHRRARRGLWFHWPTADTTKLATVTSMAAAAMEKSAWARMVIAGETPRRRGCPCFTDVRRYR
jgi:hypothetical protein